LRTSKEEEDQRGRGFKGRDGGDKEMEMDLYGAVEAGS
jgi:hypothetical protein